MKTLREQLTGKCRYFNGVPRHSDIDPTRATDRIVEHAEWQTKTCKAGVNYYQLMRIAELGDRGCLCRIPCTGDKPGSLVRGVKVEACDKYTPLTEQDIRAREAEHERLMDCLRRNVSTCCQAPIDESCVIRDGEHKGHGPRYCSKCKKLVYMV